MGMFPLERKLMSSKEITAETVVLESTPELCNQVRMELIEKFDNLWIYVYLKGNKSSSATLSVTNAWGGKLDKTTVDNLILVAKTFHNKLKLIASS